MSRDPYPLPGDGNYPPRRSRNARLLGFLLIALALALIVWTLNGLGGPV